MNYKDLSSASRIPRNGELTNDGWTINIKPAMNYCGGCVMSGISNPKAIPIFDKIVELFEEARRNKKETTDFFMIVSHRETKEEVQEYIASHPNFVVCGEFQNNKYTDNRRNVLYRLTAYPTPRGILDA